MKLKREKKKVLCIQKKIFIQQLFYLQSLKNKIIEVSKSENVKVNLLGTISNEKLLLSKNSLTLDKFLFQNSELRHVVRRAFIAEKFPYSEIQDNTIGEKLVPIDMLRLKLSFFGALKFDPRSDKWLRICMFQGAPLPNELKDYDEQWVYKTHS